MKRPSSLILVTITNVFLMASLIFGQVTVHTAFETIKLQQDLIRAQQVQIHNLQSVITGLIDCRGTFTNTVHWTTFTHDSPPSQSHP